MLNESLLEFLHRMHTSSLPTTAGRMSQCDLEVQSWRTDHRQDSRQAAGQSRQSPLSWKGTPQTLLCIPRPQQSGKGKNADWVCVRASETLGCWLQAEQWPQGSESVATLPTSAMPFPPAVSSLFSGVFKARLISALSRMHLWPGGSPDYIVNGTSCFLNQEQRPYNDNPEHHSNTIGRY